MKKLLLFIGIALLSACVEEKAKNIKTVSIMIDTTYVIMSDDGYITTLKHKPTPRVGDLLTTYWMVKY